MSILCSGRQLLIIKYVPRKRLECVIPLRTKPFNSIRRLTSNFVHIPIHMTDYMHLLYYFIIHTIWPVVRTCIHEHSYLYLFKYQVKDLNVINFKYMPLHSTGRHLSNFRHTILELNDYMY